MTTKTAVREIIQELGTELIEAREKSDQKRIADIAKCYNAIYKVWGREVDEYLAETKTPLHKREEEEEEEEVIPDFELPSHTLPVE